MKPVARMVMPAAALVWYAVSMFSRDARVFGVAICVGILLLHPTAVRTILRSAMARALLAVTAVMLLSLTVQVTVNDSPGFSQELALRQLSYYFMMPVVVFAMAVVVQHYPREFLSAGNVTAAVIAIAIASQFWPPITPDRWIWRANIENTMAFFYVYAFYVACRSTATRFAALGAYLAYSVMTEAGQGVMIFAFSLMLIFASRLRALLLYCVGLMPVWFPAFLVVTHSFNQHLDSNVDFRFRIWSEIFSNFLRGEHILGNFGYVVNPNFVKLLINAEVQGWEGIENIGAHNYVLQALQLGGFPGALAVVGFLITMANTAVRSADLRVQLCFIALGVSCSLNQAEAHLLNLFGTGVLAATLLVKPKQQMTATAIGDTRESGWPGIAEPSRQMGGRL